MFRLDNCNICDILVNLSSRLCTGYSVFEMKVSLSYVDRLQLRVRIFVLCDSACKFHSVTVSAIRSMC